MDDLVATLKEQISVLTAHLDEERRKSREKETQLRADHRAAVAGLKIEHEEAVAGLERKHEQYILLLKKHHRSTVSIIEKTLQDRIKRLRNEYALLQAALRNYQDVVRADLGKIWDEKEDDIRLECEEQAAETIRRVRTEMQRQLEIERADLMDRYEAEIEERVRHAVDKALATIAVEAEEFDSDSDLSLVETAVQQPDISEKAAAENKNTAEASIEADNERSVVIMADTKLTTAQKDPNCSEKFESVLQPSAGVVETDKSVQSTARDKSYQPAVHLKNMSLKDDDSIFFIDSDLISSDTCTSYTARHSESSNLVLENVSDDDNDRY